MTLKNGLKPHILWSRLHRDTTRQRHLASRLGDGAGQKSVWNLLNAQHSPTLKTLEPICRALMVSPAALMVPGLDTSLLVSRRLPRLIEKYARMTPTQRDNLEDVIAGMIGE